MLPNDQDGVPHLTTSPRPPHSSFTYKYKITHSGTYWYHSHTGLQEQEGVYGSLVFHPKNGELIKTDKDYEESSNTYMKTSPEDFPYLRYETSLFVAFDGLPKMIKPSEDSTVFELRTYEGYNEDALNRKIKMFNESEFKIFEDVGLHSVFFGEKIAGPQMPCLTYMVAFKDMEERNDNWEKFGPHPEWKRIVGMPEYENTVSNIYRVFLKPMSFSKL